MPELTLLIAGLFLPLFPLSMVFNVLFDRIKAPFLRALLLVVWPQIGIAIAYSSGIEIPFWILLWALFTSLLYGFRALVLREVSLWISFLATSSWAILWLIMSHEASSASLILYALSFSIPLALLAYLSHELETRFGAAYTGLYNGISETLPRLSGVLTIVVLAIIATPVFPSFSAMLSAIISLSTESLTIALLICSVWFVWGWAGARLLQGLIIGEATDQSVTDLSRSRAWLYALVLIVLATSGLYMIGNLS